MFKAEDKEKGGKDGGTLRYHNFVHSRMHGNYIISIFFSSVEPLRVMS